MPISKVRYSLVPTGTDTRDLAEQIGVTTSTEIDGRTWWVHDWSYPNEPILAHLLVEASGPGGTTEQQPFDLYHEAGTGPCSPVRRTLDARPPPLPARKRAVSRRLSTWAVNCRSPDQDEGPAPLGAGP